MCNLYLMYYVDQGQANFHECFDEADKEVTSHLPPDSDRALPSNPELEVMAKSHPHHIQNHIESSSDGNSPNHHIKSHILPSQSANWQNVTLKMPGAFPKSDDSYLCSSFMVKEWINEAPVYITNFRVDTTASKVHHLIIQGCDSPVKQPGQIW